MVFLSIGVIILKDDGKMVWYVFIFDLFFEEIDDLKIRMYKVG